MDKDRQRRHYEKKHSNWSEFEYGKWFTTERGRTVDELEKEALARIFGELHVSSMLDVGVGNGRLIPVYRDSADHLTCIDISGKLLKQAVEVAKHMGLPHTATICGDASVLDFPDAVFDLVFCSRVLQHVYDWKAAVGEFHRVLKPGGVLVLMTYNRWSLYGMLKWIQHMARKDKGRFRNPVSLRRTLSKNGFEISACIGALAAQPAVFPSFALGAIKRFLLATDKLARHRPLGWFGERMIVLAKKKP